MEFSVPVCELTSEVGWEGGGGISISISSHFRNTDPGEIREVGSQGSGSDHGEQSKLVSLKIISDTTALAASRQ